MRRVNPAASSEQPHNNDKFFNKSQISQVSGEITLMNENFIEKKKILSVRIACDTNEIPQNKRGASSWKEFLVNSGLK